MTKIQKQRAPALRFKDDDGGDYPDWEEKRFSAIAEKVSSFHNPANDNNNYACIELDSLSSGTGQLLKTFDSSNQKSIKTRFRSGDVLFGKLRPYLRKFYLAQFDGVCTSEIWVLRHVSVLSTYLYQLVQSHLFSRVANIQSGTKMPRSDWNIVSQSVFSIPSEQSEQQKIATFLSAVDTKTEQLNKKKSLLEQYKKGMMQKLFSQEIRFKEEDGKDYPDWEEKLLGAISKLSKGKGISKSDVVTDGTLKCIRYGELYTHYGTTISRVISSTDIPPSQLELSNKNDVIIPSSGETATDIATAACLRLDGVALGGDINIIRCQQNGVFLAYYLNYKKPDIARLAQGISVIHLYASQLRLLKLGIPSKEEQQKIADFLSALDRKIELVAGQIEQTRCFKQGLLQRMFI